MVRCHLCNIYQVRARRLAPRVNIAVGIRSIGHNREDASRDAPLSALDPSSRSRAGGGTSVKDGIDPKGVAALTEGETK